MEFIFYMHNICLKREGGGGEKKWEKNEKEKGDFECPFFF
jgi:hypothetical protein